MDVLLQPPEQTRSRRKAEVVNELMWVAAKRTFTSPGPWPLNPQGRERVVVGGGQKNVHQPWPLALSTLSVRGRERVAGVAAQRTFTVPGPWPLCFHSWLSYLPYYYSFHRWPSGADAARAQPRRAPARSLVGAVESSASVLYDEPGPCCTDAHEPRARARRKRPP